ncbi:MAG: hypothetical protein ACFFBH_02665 [Promethearchaeota archaeon]
MLNTKNIKFQGPLILKIFGLLNDLNLTNENRYILCNFLDQNSELFGLKKDIYDSNHHYSLNQLFLFAFHKARSCNMLKGLYNEYITSINAICNKVDTKNI